MCSDGKVSIIVPIYNREKYICRALDSILNQTYRNYEVVLMDDGSTDRSGEICKKYASEDDRIHYYHQENCGVAKARNNALKHVSGNMIAFVDADDCVTKDYLEKMLDQKNRYSAQMVICGFKRFSGDKPDVLEDQKYTPIVWNHDKALLNCYGQHGPAVCSVLWNKIYDADLFNGLSFPEGLRNEDEFLMPRLLDKCERVVFSDVPLYFYYENDSSITTSDSYILSTDIYKIYDDRLELFSNKIGDYSRFIALTKKEYLDRIISRYKKSRNKMLYDLYKEKFQLYKDSVGNGYRVFYISPVLYFALVKIMGK